jgi:hypothetical protein
MAAMNVLRSAGLGLLLLILLVLDVVSGNVLHYADEIDYEQEARAIIHQHAFAAADGKLTADRPPGYPIFIAAAYLIDERPLVAKIENSLTLLLATVLLGLAAARIHPRATVFTPYLVIAYPLLLYAASVLYPQVLGCLLLTATVLLLSGERVSLRGALAAGVIYGALILAIPYFLMLIPVFAGVIFLRAGATGSSRWLRVAVFTIVAAAVVVPWTVRNYVQFHEFIPVSTNSGKNLFVGNSPVTTPNSGRTTDVIPLCKHLQEGMDEYQGDRAMGQCAIEWITQNPGAAAWLYVGKVVNYFNFRNEIATREVVAPWRDWLMFCTYYPLLALALARLALWRRFALTRLEVLIYVLYFVNGLVSAIYFTRIRFRIPFDFLLIALVAAFVCRLWDARRKVVDSRARQNVASVNMTKSGRMVHQWDSDRLVSNC